MEGGAPGGPSAGVPLNQEEIEMYVEYLSHKGVASDSAIRYPTRNWYQRNFLLSSSQEISDVVKSSLQTEGVDVENQTINSVPGFWVVNAHSRSARDVRDRQIKLLEVGQEGAPRRASVLRRVDPNRFRHHKWNGSPECLTICWSEYEEQFLYRNEHGAFPYMSDAEVQKYEEVGVYVMDRPSKADCSAFNRYCGPCGGSSGEIFPCMICENWTHMGCSYGVEGGRVCASHVTVLDAALGLAIILTDPTDRLCGTILRPTAVFGQTSSAPKKKKFGNNWVTRDTEGQRYWELIAMYKSIWLAAGLEYDHGLEATHVALIKFERGYVERLTEFEHYSYTSPNTAQRRMSRALLLETTPAYLSHEVEAPEREDRNVRRRFKFRHIAHQYRQVQQDEMTARLNQLPASPSEVRTTQLFHPGWTRDLHYLRNIPADYERSPFVQLTYANEGDRALEYQHLVVKELARKAFNWDHRQLIPSPTYMQDLVTHDQDAAYVRDPAWPWTSLTMACSSLLDYNRLLAKAHEFSRNQQATEVQNVEMQPVSEDERMPSSDEEVLFANEEEDRELRASFAASSNAMETDYGTRGGPSAHVPVVPEAVETPSGSKATGTPGGPSAGVPKQPPIGSPVVETPSILKKNEDYVREITQETF
eukprot:5745478-Amphidinium_carterae.1